MAERDLWDPTESDNRLAHFRGTVVEDYYSTDRQESGGKAVYDGADRVNRYWVIHLDDVYQDWENEVPETITRKFGIGKGWYKTDDGTVRHESETTDEETQGFDIKSGFGQLLGLIQGKRKEWKARRVVVMDGGDEEVEYDFGAVRGYFKSLEVSSPRTPGIFVGTTWDFRGLGLVYNDGDEARSQPYPVAFIGADTDAVQSNSAGKASAEVTQEQVAGYMDGAGDDELHSALAKLLNTSANKAAFQRNAVKLAGDDETLNEYVMADDGLWSLKV